MNQNLFIFSLYEVSLSLIFGLLTIYIALKIIDKLVLKVKTLEMIKQGNVAIAVFKGTLILCTLMLVQNSVFPSVDAFRAMASAHNTLNFTMFGISFGYFILFYSISLIFSILLILLTFFIYIKATTNVDEIAEINKNNLAVSFIISIIILGMTLFMRPAFNNLITSFVDYSKLQKIEIQDTNTGGGNVKIQKINPPN